MHVHSKTDVFYMLVWKVKCSNKIAWSNLLQSVMRWNCLSIYKTLLVIDVGGLFGSCDTEQKMRNYFRSLLICWWSNLSLTFSATEISLKPIYIYLVPQARQDNWSQTYCRCADNSHTACSSLVLLVAMPPHVVTRELVSNLIHFTSYEMRKK